MAGILAGDSTSSHYRPLWGQATYGLNLDLAYGNIGLGLITNLNYNVNGKRLSERQPWSNARYL